MAEKLSVKIYNSVKKDIEEGRIDPREFFSEAQIAEKYGVSKAPVRDALHLLASEGYLVSYHRKGYMVNSYSIDEINQIQTIRRSLEHLSVELVIKNATDEEIHSLYALAEASEESTTNMMFHMGIAKISGNRYLPDALGGFLSKIYVAMRKDKVDADRHCALVDALASRDLDAAIECLNKDIYFL